MLIKYQITPLSKESVDYLITKIIISYSPRLVQMILDCQVNDTVKIQKRMESIVRILHQWFNHNVMKRREYFLYAKKIKMLNN